jgi:hypothetical protein
MSRCPGGLTNKGSLVTPGHIAGLVVGEGCFYAESSLDPSYRLGWRIRPAFCIEMRHDDREPLELVRAHLDCGAIYSLDFGRYRGYEGRGWRPHLKYRVTNIEELHGKVVPFFDEHPLFGRKKGAFSLFASIVELVWGKKHLTERGLEEAKDLAFQLAHHNSRGQRPYGAPPPPSATALRDPHRSA